jgi:predicted RNase H-like nuclease (RuvC/YqgF family)
VFKEQIASIEGDRERSISILQNQLKAARQEIEQLKNRIESLRQTNIDNERDSSQIGINNDFSKDDLPWAYAERQQGEVIRLSYFTENILNILPTQLSYDYEL